MLQRAGAADDYAGTVPSRQVGILSSEGTDNSFDDFKAMDIAGPFEADGSKPLRASVSPWFYFPSPILHFAFSTHDFSVPSALSATQRFSPRT